MEKIATKIISQPESDGVKASWSELSFYLKGQADRFCLATNLLIRDGQQGCCLIYHLLATNASSENNNNAWNVNFDNGNRNNNNKNTNQHRVRCVSASRRMIIQKEKFKADSVYSKQWAESAFAIFIHS